VDREEGYACGGLQKRHIRSIVCAGGGNVLNSLYSGVVFHIMRKALVISGKTRRLQKEGSKEMDG
jgi:hypothetical protein